MYVFGCESDQSKVYLELTAYPTAYSTASPGAGNKQNAWWFDYNFDINVAFDEYVWGLSAILGFVYWVWCSV